MDDKIFKKIKLAVTILIIVLFVWFLILSPLIAFNKYEKQMTEAGQKYFKTYSNELPTGERVKTLTLQDLYYKAFVKEDFYIPYTKKPCDLKESWVKVKKVDGEYKYFTYLKCGVLQSMIDHKGPKVTLKGEETLKVARGDKYKELGVETVIDNKDGKLEPKDVEIRGKVDTSKVGTYEIKYVAFDTLKNRTEVVRKVIVEEQLKNTVMEKTSKKGYYTGNPDNNYIYLSKMLFRIIGIENGNVVVVADEDVANVNYAGLDEWLDYYYEHINKKTKESLVKNKYCDMKLNDMTLNTNECNSYTKERYVYIPSIVDINKAQTNMGNFMRPSTMSWTANAKDDKMAYLTRDAFFSDKTAKVKAYDKTSNYGVRPKLTIKGNTLIVAGDGTRNNPYSIGDVKKAAGGDYLNTRITGEYIKYSGMLWRIVDVQKDGTTKVISQETLFSEEQPVLYYYNPSENNTIYNPNKKGNVGYLINNRATEYVNTKYFVNHEIEVPIYKDKIQYNKEASTKKYKVRLAAPNMYEMFSAYAMNDDNLKSHWLINSSNTKYINGAMTDIGVIVNEKINAYDRYGVRVTGYLHKNILITSGHGTHNVPYVIAK